MPSKIIIKNPLSWGLIVMTTEPVKIGAKNTPPRPPVLQTS